MFIIQYIFIMTESHTATRSLGSVYVNKIYKIYFLFLFYRYLLRLLVKLFSVEFSTPQD